MPVGLVFWCFQGVQKDTSGTGLMNLWRMNLIIKGYSELKKQRLDQETGILVLFERNAHTNL